MKYVIMCACPSGATRPRQMIEVCGESLIERTIRLLSENGVEDIAISTHHPAFDALGVPILAHDNGYYDGNGLWVDAFCPLNEPACYVFGDVLFSPEAIRKIVQTETDDVEFFASAPPFGDHYAKQWAEPFAFKVANQDHFRICIDQVRELWKAGKFNRPPIAWELWQVIKNTPLNVIFYNNYTAINDYTCDIDEGDAMPQWGFLEKGKHSV